MLLYKYGNRKKNICVIIYKKTWQYLKIKEIKIW